MKSRKPIFIIEHLEPELYEWCLIEYRQISKIIGKKSLWFTNIKGKKSASKLKNYGKVAQESVKNLDLKDACLLDPEAKSQLKPKDAKKFKYFIFGGILGDFPPRKRTQDELTSFIKAPAFNITSKQMSTDTAVYVVKQITLGKSLKNMLFIDNPEIKINKIESTILPYRYVMRKGGKPLISRALLKFLKK